MAQKEGTPPFPFFRALQIAPRQRIVFRAKNYKGDYYLDIRTQWVDKDTGEWVFGPQGVQISLKEDGDFDGEEMNQADAAILAMQEFEEMFVAAQKGGSL